MSAPATPSTPTSATSPQPSSKGGFLRSLALKPSSRSATDDSASSAPKSKPAKEKKPKHEASPLEQELMLMQFLGGGSMARNEKRYAEKQAKAAGATKVNGQLVGVSELHRDARGGRWRDQDEELEFRGLLANADEVDPLDASAHPSSHSSKSRHRPEPLSLVPQNTDRRADSARREFIESSFNPTGKPIFSGPNPSSVTVDSHASKQSRLKRLFKSRSN